MPSNTAVTATLTLQISDLLTPGQPVTYTRSPGPSIFNSGTNINMDYFLVNPPGAGLLIFATTGNSIGTIYIKNNSSKGTPAATIRFVVGGSTALFPFPNGGIFLYSIPGNTGTDGFPVNPILTDITVLTTVIIPIEFLISF